MPYDIYDTRGSDVAARAGSPSIGDNTDPAWGATLTKALADLSKGTNAQQAGSGSGGQSGVGGMSPAQSGIGGGRAPSLDALVQLLAQRYQALYPGGGSSKGLLGV